MPVAPKGDRHRCVPRHGRVAQGLGGIPGMTHLATSQMKKAIADLDVPEVPEFLDQIVASGDTCGPAACRRTCST